MSRLPDDCYSRLLQELSAIPGSQHTMRRNAQPSAQHARKHNIRLIVKSSGHDFIGRSNAPNSLSIWTHHMKGIKTHNSFRPNRCKVAIKKTAVTVGAGMQMKDIYSALDPLSQTIVGGSRKTVSVGGLLTGAGHSLLSPRYGLSADEVLEMELVTPQGEIVTANECQNTDLFWAMRGGGGSTFGIITSLTMLTHPTPKLDTVTLIIATSDISRQRTIFSMVAYVLSTFPRLADAGMSGYNYFFSSFPNPLDNGNTTVGGILLAMALQDASPEIMKALWDPVLAHIETTWPGLFQVMYQPRAYPTYLAWFMARNDTMQAGTNTHIGSRLLDEKALTKGGLRRRAEALRVFAGGEVATVFLVSGKGVHEARPRGCGNAVLPAWRRAYVHATLGVDFKPLDPAAAAAASEQVKTRVSALRQLAPDMGAYMNEADFEEPNWQHEFWGANYKRLLRIKRAVDPDDVFWCNPCVGNERWEQVGDRLCRVRDDNQGLSQARANEMRCSLGMGP
ncbi:hypothetical protein N0V88_003666 [Collariella sp. IMI 366227]|nr:hypothetical protein N0V88_003666 [Collariella sp. IMI 366227]